MGKKRSTQDNPVPMDTDVSRHKSASQPAISRKDTIEVDEQWEVRSWIEFTAESKQRALQAKIKSASNSNSTPAKKNVAGSDTKIVVVSRCGKNYLSVEKEFGNITRDDVIYLKREADNKSWECVLDGDLRGLDLRGLDLGAINFSGADLRESTFIHAVCRHTNFAGVDLSGSDLTDGDFLEANFSEANMSRVLAARAEFLHANFQRAKLHYADFSYADLTGADFTKARLFRMRFGGATLNKAKISLTGLLMNFISRSIPFPS